jgi:hypothetical protein
VSGGILQGLFDRPRPSGLGSRLSKAIPVVPASLSLGQALETETVGALSPVHRVLLQQAPGAGGFGEGGFGAVFGSGTGEVAFSIQPLHLTAQAVETDAASSLTPVHHIHLGTAGGTGFGEDDFGEGDFGGGGGQEVANSITALAGVSIGQALEIDSGGAITPLKPIFVPLALATETNTADTIGVEGQAAIGQAIETDTAAVFTAGAPSFITLDQAIELDTAEQVGPGQGFILNPATETDTADSFSITHRVALGQALETDSAPAFGIIGAFRVFRLIGGDRASTVVGSTMRVTGYDQKRDR